MATEPTMMAQVETIPDCRVVKVVYPEHERRTLTEFMHEFQACGPRVWIHRDPRDQLLSAFFYTWFRAHHMPEARFRTALSLVRAREQGERISFFEVLCKTFGPNTYYHGSSYHLDRVLPFFKSNASRELYWFAYDDLVTERFGGLSEYLGIPLGRAEVSPDHARVARSRGSGGWRRWFEPEDADHFRPLLGPYMELMGYADEWETSDEAPDATSGSCYMIWLWAGGVGQRPRTPEEADELLARVTQDEDATTQHREK